MDTTENTGLNKPKNERLKNVHPPFHHPNRARVALAPFGPIRTETQATGDFCLSRRNLHHQLGLAQADLLQHLQHAGHRRSAGKSLGSDDHNRLFSL